MNDFYSNNIITIWVVTFVFEVLMGIVAQTIAEKKGHSKRWFWAGFLLSLIGVIWTAGLPDETLRRQFKRLHDRTETPATADSGGSIPTAAGDDELTAVIVAAVAAVGEDEGKRFILRSFRPAGESSTAWNREARVGPSGSRR